MERKARAASLSGIYLLLVAIVLVVVNVLAYGVNKRFDATKSERFTLSKGSANLVSKGLAESMTVTLYVTRGLPKTDIFVEDLLNLMSEYEQASGGKLKYVVKEPKKDEERQEAKDAGLQEAAFGEGSETGDQVNMTKGFMGMVFEYGSEKEVIPILSPDNTTGLEFWVTNKIRLIRDKVEDSYPEIGLLQKDGLKITEANLVPSGQGPGPNIKGLLQQHFPFYKFKDVDLEGGDKEIDDNDGKLKGLIMMQADKEWTDKELGRIDQFMMRGDKSLLVISGAVNMKSSDASMKADLDLRGVEKLVSGYGVEMKKEAILDWGLLMRIPVQNQLGSMEWQLVPGVLQVQHQADLEDKEQLLDNGFIGFFRMDELAVPFPSTLVAHPEKQPKAKLKTVLRSSPNSTVASASPVEMKPSSSWKPQGELGQRDIAVEVVGVLKSAFSDKEHPAGKDVPKESKAPSRILVLASGQFLANPFARAGNPPPLPPQMAMMGSFGGDQYLQAIARPYAMQYMTNTILAFKNLLDWMSNDTDLIAASAKLLGEPNLTYADIAKPKVDMTKDDDKAVQRKFEDYKNQRSTVQQKVQWSLTLLPPLFFMFFGIGRWRMRENNRDRVRL